MNNKKAAITLIEIANLLDKLDPDHFDQENFYNAIGYDETCGCIAAHSYWQKHGRKPNRDVTLIDAPAVAALEYIAREEGMSEEWSCYVFEVSEEGEVSADELGVSYYGVSPKNGASRIREFLKEAGYPTELVTTTNELGNLV